MANDFTKSGNVVLHATFTGDDPFGDKSGRGNHLYTQGGPTLDIVNMRSGDGCADFEADNLEGLSIQDVDTSASFPAKSGSSNTTFSAVGWFKCETVSGGPVVFGKYDHGTNRRSWCVQINATTSKVNILYGYNSGVNVRQYEINRVISAGVWYFIKAVWNDAGNSCTGYLYDSSNTTWYSVTGSPTDALNCEDAPFYIGRQGGGSYFDGLIQGVAIFGDVVSDAEAQQMVAGTYNYNSDANLISWYKLGKKGLGWDEKENNHLRSTGVAGFSGPRDDINAVWFDGDYQAYIGRADSVLSLDFPGKFGQSNEVITACMWFQPINKDNGIYSFHPVGKATLNTGIAVLGWPPDDKPVASYMGDVSTNTGPGIAISNANWYHWAAVIDKANTRIFTRLYDLTADLAYSAERLTATGTFTTAEPLRLGWTYSPLNRFDGFVGELVIFNKALSVANIDRIRRGLFGAGGASNSNLWLGTHF